MATILVTGATGKLARPALQPLLKKGHTVRALVRNPSAAKELPEFKGIELAPGSFDRHDALQKALSGVDNVLLLTPSNPDAALSVYHVLEAARFTRKVHVVRVSTWGAQLDAPTEDARVHGQAEAYVRGSGFPFTVVRPQFLMQNLLGVAGTIAEYGSFAHGAGDGKVSMLDARDVSDALVTLLDNPKSHAGLTYQLTGPTAIGFADVAQILSKALGRPIEYLKVTPQQVMWSLRWLGTNEWLAKVLCEQSAALSTAWGSRVTEDFQRLVGRAPRSFTQFVEDIFAPLVKPLLKAPKPKPGTSGLPEYLLKK